MTGIGKAISNPIPPVDKLDIRRPVKDIINSNRHIIDEVKRALLSETYYNSNKHDDLWILRFVLSHRWTGSAVKAAKDTIQFRAKHNLDNEDIRYHPPFPVANNKSIEVFGYSTWLEDDAIRFTLPDAKRGVIGFLRLDSFDQENLVDHTSEDDWPPCFRYVTEWSHQWVDYVTRTTGLFTKAIRIVDLTGVCRTKGTSLLGINREMNRRDWKAMRPMERHYPQLLEGT
jgi:hypothetical protein